jgi:hypothetical protein
MPRRQRDMGAIVARPPVPGYTWGASPITMQPRGPIAIGPARYYPTQQYNPLPGRTTSSTPPTLSPAPPAVAPIVPTANPVPPGYPTGSVFVDASGNSWAYSGGVWTNLGSGAGAQANAANVAASNASASLTSTSPVPASWPTTSVYVDSSGNVWAYSGSAWENYGSGANAQSQAALVANAQAQALTASGASTTSPAPVTVTTSSDDFQSVLTWFSDTDVLGGLGIAGVPNWVPAAGIGLLLAKVFAGQQTGRR